MEPSRILVLRAGQPAPALELQAGDYAAWFAEGLGPGAALHPVAAFSGEPLPDPRGFDAVLMTGSPLSVRTYDADAWQQRAGRLLLDAAELGKPVLGVCFGHQLLARALGGEVQKNPRGREIGTISVQLTDAGRAHPLLGALEPTFNATHEDAVTRLPASATLLAENPFGIQAFSVGPRILAVQFHPELDARRTRALIQTRESILRLEGLYEPALASVRETPSGPALLRRWLGPVRG